MNLEVFQQYPIIAAVRDDESLEKSLQSDVSIIFILYGDIVTIPEIVNKVKTHGKYAIVHLDFINGLSSHESVLAYVKVVCGADGIVTTRRNLITPAKKQGLFAIMRYFSTDHLSVENICNQAQNVKPDMVEVMPALATRIIEELNVKIDVPVISGGLLSTKKEVLAALAAGAVCVSSSDEEIWRL